MPPSDGIARAYINLAFMQKEKEINKKLTAAIATTASLFSICALAGGVVGNQAGALQNFNTVNVTGATNNNSGGTNKDRETLSITPVDANGPIADAKCILTNAKGDWSLTAPDSVDVRRSDSDLQIKCEKPGYEPVVTTVKASTTEVPRPQFHFGTDAGGDGDESATITVPQYAASITVTFNSSKTSTN